MGEFGMPLYEYQCMKCGTIEEAIQKFSDAPLSTCRHCSGQLNKLISQSSFHLKGSGWYVTDYAKTPTSPKASAPTEAKPASDKKTPDSSASSTSSAKDT
jgi:putative FmdB family regulatory protein